MLRLSIAPAGGLAMNTSRVFLAAALAVVVVCASALPGCARQRREQMSIVTRTYADTMFENHADVPVRVTVWVCERTSTPPGIGSSFRDTPRVLLPGGKHKVLVREARAYGVGFLWPEDVEPVIRFKLERIGATWEAPVEAWYEVVGPLPQQIDIRAGQSDREAFGAPVPSARDARIEPVPREWWPSDH
jgi:hypothetical protein